MSNWKHIIKSVSLASSKYHKLCTATVSVLTSKIVSLANYSEADYENKEEPPLPETLVRLRVDNEEEADE